MIRRTFLFAIWAVIGFGLSLEFLYFFTPFGLAGMAAIAVVAWVLEGRGWDQQPEIWGLLAGPGAFFLLVASSAEPANGWAAAGAATVAVSLVGFAVSGRMRCASEG